MKTKRVYAGIGPAGQKDYLLFGGEKSVPYLYILNLTGVRRVCDHSALQSPAYWGCYRAAGDHNPFLDNPRSYKNYGLAFARSNIHFDPVSFHLEFVRPGGIHRDLVFKIKPFIPSIAISL